MRDKELYKQILGIQAPWEVTEVEPSMAADEVTVHVEQEAGEQQSCPHCGPPSGNCWSNKAFSPNP